MYEAYDRERDSVVALKVLRQDDAAALYRFKREFRALADVTHFNLVSLYELMSDGRRWFFTMEMVKGVNFLEHVRGGAGPAPLDSFPDYAETTTLPLRDADPARFDKAEPQVILFKEKKGRRSVIPLHVDRLRRALRQLAEGVRALHQAGQLHRDLKPSNVLVTPEGRVVILDFGLVAELTPEGAGESVQVVGTPAYMAPEQGGGLSVSGASDWYSVGVMIYEALVGRPPFTGRYLEVLVNKQRYEPPPPSELVIGIPEDLNALCRDLLRRDPAARPAGPEVLGRLAAAPGEPVTAAVSPIRAVPLVGRERHLAALKEALQATRQGHAVTVYLHGSSGMGKTALAHHFLEGLRQRDDVVALAGRCYERESVPYKALDSLVDALSQYLKRLPPEQADAFLPRDVAALARLFPVLRQVEAVSRARRRVLEIPDSQELRRRAFAALRELLARLADRTSLVLFIDDLHWGDVDSAALLGELVRPPEPPALLLIAGYRSEEAETSPFLRTLLPLLSGDARQLVVGELAPAEARDLALALLGEDPGVAGARADAIARESGGNPFFVDELVRYSRAESGMAGPRETTLDQVIQRRVAQLPERERRLLEVVAVAGQPLELGVARRAAELQSQEIPVVVTLGSAHLVRTRGAGDREEIETYHDRIRETVLAHLPPGRLKNHHHRLAQTLETAGRADPETLAVHFRAAGDNERAAEYGTAAAAKASEALAFDRAARLYRFVLDLGVAKEPEARALRINLGDALASAGRGPEAAREYLTAAGEAKAAERLELQRRAAEQFLRSGHIDEGIAALRNVLGTMGMKLAGTPRQALVSFLLRRARIALRGLRFRERDATQLSAEQLMRIDTCWSVAVGLGIVDSIRGADFHTLHLLLALRAGEPYRVARALAIEVGYSATAGVRSRRRTARLVRTTLSLAGRINHPHALGLATLTAGIAAYLEGRWSDGRRLTQRAETMLREHCAGVAWELANAQIFCFLSLYYMGELGEMSRRLPAILKDVEQRGDLFAATSLRARISYLAHLAADDPGGALREVNQAIGRWSQQGFHVQHLWAMVGQMEIGLYCGDNATAWNCIVETWPALARSLLLRIQQPFVGCLHHRARCALALAAERREEARALLRAAGRDVGRMEREKTPWGDAMAQLVRAGIAATRGDTGHAAALAASAEAALEAADMRLYAAAARRRRGELIGGDQGKALVQAADDWMSGQEIRNPARMTAMLAPGRWS